MHTPFDYWAHPLRPFRGPDYTNVPVHPLGAAYGPGVPYGNGYWYPYPAWSPYSQAHWYRQQTPPFQGGPERPSERPPHTQHVDWASKYPGEVILQGPNVKRVALTFDDGPDDVWTPQVLTVLSQLRIASTFMCVGRRVEANPQVLRRIIREGHVVGNHTYDHPNLTKVPISEVQSEIQRTDEAVQRVGGVRPRLFRPPYGSLNDAVIQEIIRLGDMILFWNVDSLDWSGLTAEQVSINVLAHTRPGSIILFHAAGGTGESLADTVQALPYIARTLRNEGYSFATIPELLNIQPYKTGTTRR